jgi:transcriptional regulator with XRE-family HTH domain
MSRRAITNKQVFEYLPVGGTGLSHMTIQCRCARPTTGEEPLAKSKSTGEPPRYGRGTGIPNPVDIHVGKRIRMRRLLLGMNQETLANALGLTFQQVQKYEGGANRVSASRLAATAEILKVPISFFFGDLQTDDAEPTAAQREWREYLDRPETIELIRLYYAIPDPRVRQQFLEMVKAIAAPEEGQR